MGQALVTLPDGRKAKVTFDSQEQLDATVSDLVAHSAPKQEPQEQTFFPQSIKQAKAEAPRALGLTARHAAEGLFALPGMVGNAANTGLNKVLDMAESVSGKKIDFRFADPNAEFSGLLTKSGLPQPETATERVVGDVSRAVAGAGSGIGIAKGVQSGSQGVTQAVAEKLAQAPGMQAASAASSGAAGGVTREAGGGPWAQFTSSVAGGFAPFTLLEGGKAVARGGRALAEPLTESGRKQIVGRTLNQVADDPAKAQANMAASTELVPGSKPTAAQVSKDYGIISTERAVKATNPRDFATRASEQNTARQDYLGVAAKDQAAVDNLVNRREQVTTNLRDAAFNQAKGKKVDNAALLSRIDKLIADPDNAGETTQKALQWARGQLEGKTDPRAVYAVRKDIALKIAGKVSAEESVLRYAGKELSAVRDMIDDGISGVAPIWKQYLTKYRQLSRPIDRMTALQSSQEKASFAPADALTGREVLTQAKWKSQVKSLLADGNLTKGQQQRVQRIADDLNRGMAVNDPNIRAIGSNTTQDLTAANVLGQMLGSQKMAPFARSVMRPLQWVYKIPEQELQTLLSDALLDPKIGAALMQKASGANVARVSQLLRERFVASGLGTVAAETTQQQSPEKDN